MHEVRRAHSSMRPNLTDQELAEVTHRCIPAVRECCCRDGMAVEVVAKLACSGLNLGIKSNAVMPGVTIDEFSG